MFVQVIPADSYNMTLWTGGSTTELYIYPEGSQYQVRDFIFRLSKATIETDESTFTPLEGVSRCLMLLEGSLTLWHGTQAPKTLQRFEVSTFKGTEITKSRGEAEGFNLMLGENAKGTLIHKALKKGACWIQDAPLSYNVFACYVYQGAGKVHISNAIYNALACDLILLEDVKQGNPFVIQAVEDCILVMAFIAY